MESSRNQINKIKHKRYLNALSAPAIVEKKNITILSLDYDGCGDFLFEAALEKGFFKNRCDPEHASYLQGYNGAIQAARVALNDMLSTEASGAAIVELFVGSTRQSRKLDRYNSARYNTGLCFEMYADLAEQKNWYFNKMLLADLVDNKGELRTEPLKLGTAMGALKKNHQGLYKYEEDAFADTLERYKNDKLKIKLLSYQIKVIINKYPNDNIKFVFVDDRLDILDALNIHFNSGAPNSLCLNLQNVELKLIHYDAARFLCKYGGLSTDSMMLIGEAKKQIHYIAPTIQEHTLTLQTTSKSTQKAVISMGLFSKLNKPDVIVDYKFLFQSLFLLGSCLGILIMGGMLFSGAHKNSEREEPSVDALSKYSV